MTLDLNLESTACGRAQAAIGGDHRRALSRPPAVVHRERPAGAEAGVSRSSRPVGPDPGARSRASVTFAHVPSGAGMVVLSGGDAVRYAPLTGPRDG